LDTNIIYVEIEY